MKGSLQKHSSCISALCSRRVSEVLKANIRRKRLDFFFHLQFQITFIGDNLNYALLLYLLSSQNNFLSWFNMFCEGLLDSLFIINNFLNWENIHVFFLNNSDFVITCNNTETIGNLSTWQHPVFDVSKFHNRSGWAVINWKEWYFFVKHYI